MVKQKSKAIVVCKMAIVLFITTSCAQAESPHATQTLPAPLIQVTHIAPTVTAAPTLTHTPPAQIPIPKSDTEQLAAQLFGARVISQISIPALNIESEVIPVGWRVHYEDAFQSDAFEWDSPGAKVGWVITSALPDDSAGNVVLYGHNNTYQKVFLNLFELSEGKKIYLQTGERRWEYKVRYNLLLPILGASAEQIQSYQQYLEPKTDARVTLISCWPPFSNTHRVVVIAMRVTVP